MVGYAIQNIERLETSYIIGKVKREVIIQFLRNFPSRNQGFHLI